MSRRNAFLALSALFALSFLIFAAPSEAQQRRFPQGYYESRFNFIAELVEVKAGETLVVQDQTGTEWSFEIPEGMQAKLDRKSLFSSSKAVALDHLETGQQLRLRVQTTPRRLQSITVLTSETVPSIPGQGVGYQQGRSWTYQPHVKNP